MILICYGTRPEWIKVKPLIELLKSNDIKFKTLFTGQHKDIVDKNADYNLSIIDKSNNRLNNIVSEVLSIDDLIFESIKYILIQGDTTSVLSLSINAFHRKIKIIHLEAGLRTYDFENPYPEEMNRQLVSRIADIHLCPTENNKKNLIEEKCGGLKYVVGNTVLDNIRDVKTSYDDVVLITLHRRENHNIICDWFNEISKIANKYKNIKFILPIHPNPNVIKNRYLLNNIEVVEPLDHKELIDILSICKLVITDSGGIQEESSFLNKKVIVCREITERTETLGVGSFLCDPDRLENLFDLLINDFELNEKCPYGDGYSSENILKIIKEL